MADWQLKIYYMNRTRNNLLTNDLQARRQFVQTIAKSALGAVVLGFFPGKIIASENHYEEMTVQQVIDLIQHSVPGAPFPKTVDTIKAGDPNQKLTGIVTTMFATIEVIEKTAAINANLIIAHEPTFYNGRDDTDYLQKDELYLYKTALLKKHGITVWRFHDAHHAHRPDGVLQGVLNELGWDKLSEKGKPYIVHLPGTKLENIIAHCKKNLQIDHLRFVGDKKQICSKIALAPGSTGGRMHWNLLTTEKPDLLIVGEVDEWETSEYIRDLRASGSNISLLVLGHIVSEEPGSKWLAEWLQPQVPAIKVVHIPAKDAFSWA
ncbi:MAG: hypothetical protein RLZZ28_1236 [Bacteroidota bacterium]|jgi:putative NIF3 family GTP cyclohydrolase 1 type 2